MGYKRNDIEITEDNDPRELSEFEIEEALCRSEN